MNKKEMDNTQIFKNYLNPTKLRSVEEVKKAFFMLIEAIPKNLTEEAFNEQVADLIIEYTHHWLIST